MEVLDLKFTLSRSCRIFLSAFLECPLTKTILFLQALLPPGSTNLDSWFGGSMFIGINKNALFTFEVDSTLNQLPLVVSINIQLC